MKTTPMQSGVLSRRSFVKGLGVIGAAAAVSALPLSGCASNDETAEPADDTASSDKATEPADSTASTGIADPTEDNPITVDAENKEVRYLAEVNAVYFTELTRHGIVYAGGSNGEKAVLRGLGDEKEFYQALMDCGFEAGNNLTAEDMKAAEGEGKSIEGDPLKVTVKWDGQEDIPFIDIINCTAGDYTPDFRFGGNLESAKENNTGCVLCLDSCATGIVSDAYWPTGTSQHEVALFNGKEDVLPADGTRVIVTFTAA